MKTDVLILGGGLAGLSAAYHLQRFSKLSFLVAEKGAGLGGTAGSIKKDGFIFDHTGHLLHLHDPYGKKLILDLLGKNIAVMERRSWIYSHKTFTRYPFQANTYGLPEKIVDECLTGFLRTVHWPTKLKSAPSFRDWSLSHFGAGISRHFMFPYNEKLWRTRLDLLTTEWQGRFVPKPTAGEVMRGSLLDSTKSFGYNATFRYPVHGGIQTLPDALAARIQEGRIAANAAVRSVDLAEKVAVIDGLGEVSYSRLVNTLPLVHFLDMARPLPPAVKAARGKLRYNTVYCLNIGVDRADISDKHWIYFPEKGFVFYRAGFSSNFSKHIAPRNTSSLYIEVSRHPGERVNLGLLERQILSGLVRCGLLKKSDKILTKLWIPIECAYVVYDFERTPAVETIFRHLNKAGVESIGRYGGWKYSFMEETILDGKRCAERLADRSGVREESQAELEPLK